VIEQLDRHGSLECEEQPVGVGHLPGCGPFTVGPEDGELAIVEGDELVERHLVIGVGDVDGLVSFHDGIIVVSGALPTALLPLPVPIAWSAAIWRHARSPSHRHRSGCRAALTTRSVVTGVRAPGPC
jgi:hypothetical protein